MIDIKAISSQLHLDSEGIWISQKNLQVSYPEEASNCCFEVEDNSFWFRHRNECIKILLKNFPPNGPLFDIGGGNGYVAFSLNTAGYETILIEPHMQGAYNAHQRGVSPVICSTLKDANFYQNTLPAVGVFDVVEHIENDFSFLKEIHGLLVPHGKIYITVPAFNFLWSNDDVWAGHFRRYTIKSLKKVLQACGFKVLYSSYMFCFLPIPIFSMRTIPSLFKLRLKNPEENLKNDLKRSTGILNKILMWEVQRLSKKRTIPFGSSCVMVAEKK